MPIYDAEGRSQLGEMGRIDGHSAGMGDALTGKPPRPSPKLTPALAHDVYLEGFDEGYAQGHEKGREMRQTLLGWRPNTEAIEKLARDADRDAPEGEDRGDR